MAIFQTNLWVCEVCGVIESTTEQVSPYEDPGVFPPRDGWELHDFIQHNENLELLCCPECSKKRMEDAQ